MIQHFSRNILYGGVFVMTIREAQLYFIDLSDEQWRF
jgi:hypothetical protein